MGALPLPGGAARQSCVASHVAAGGGRGTTFCRGQVATTRPRLGCSAGVRRAVDRGGSAGGGAPLLWRARMP